MDDQSLIEPPASLSAIERLRAIMHRLRAPGGCPWDQEQSHESLIPHLLEECHELISAIGANDEDNFKEELGDVLLQVVFHAEIAQERGSFDLDAIATAISEKLISRHPHVFARDGSMPAPENSAQVLKNWEHIKAQERALKARRHAGAASASKTAAEPQLSAEYSGLLDGLGHDLPALLAAVKLQKKAAKVGFDWPDRQSVVAKVHEELAELEELLQGDTKTNTEFPSASQPAGPTESLPSAQLAALRLELGDLLFSVVNLCRHLGLNPEHCLLETNAKFRKRFAHMQQALESEGLRLEEANLAQMEAYWQRAKSHKSHCE